VNEDDLAEGSVTHEWQAFAAAHAARARDHLDSGLRLLDDLDQRSALCVATFAGLYRATLDRIESAGYDVFGAPPHLSPLTKLRIVGGGLLR
jgi:phytoene synthase